MRLAQPVPILRILDEAKAREFNRVVFYHDLDGRLDTGAARDTSMTPVGFDPVRRRFWPKDC